MSVEDRLSMPLGEAMFSLRAIRRLKPDPIPDEDIRVILDAAIRAPNGGNAQKWHYLVVKDEAIRKQFAPLYRDAWWAKRNDEGYTGPDDLPEKYRPAMRFADEISEAPVLVFACATVQGRGAAESVIPATQNLLLAARALGVGGTLTTLHPSVDERVNQLLGIPNEAQIVYCIPLGYPRGRFGPNQRKPLTEVVSYNHWGSDVPWG